MSKGAALLLRRFRRHLRFRKVLVYDPWGKRGVYVPACRRCYRSKRRCTREHGRSMGANWSIASPLESSGTFLNMTASLRLIQSSLREKVARRVFRHYDVECLLLHSDDPTPHYGFIDKRNASRETDLTLRLRLISLHECLKHGK